MKLLIKMSSILVSTALQDILRKKVGNCKVVADVEGKDISDFEPDLILVDFSSLERHQFQRWPDAKVVLLDTGIDENQLVSKLVYYKLNGIISTRTNLKLFKKALQEIFAGHIWIDNSKLKALVHNHESIKEMQSMESFSHKERQIIGFISQGFKNREIATALAISEQTVKAHLNRIFRKVKVTNRFQLIPLAMKLKLPQTL